MSFFEKLLNTGFKQESGQFFTPVPLTRFIINSLPIKEIIQQKLDDEDPDFLPFIIDYAMGTGHFLTEAMDEVQEIIKRGGLSTEDKESEKLLVSYRSENEHFKWAAKYIYGIERDYRLVKTAKVACFLHGDGLANVIHGNGLDSFESSSDYRGKLKGKDKDNPVFDILIANPPYSVASFKNTLPEGGKSFTLYDSLTDQSSEIECLFVERTKQLVKTGGYAAIILPSSILNNGGIYAKARKILLKHFKIYAISEFGSNTFMATGTNTVVLFMKRRDDNLYRDIAKIVSDFLGNYKDVTCNRLENAFFYYAQSVYGLNLEDYVSLLEGNEIKHDIFKDYEKANKSSSLKDFIQDKEREKLIFYILNTHVKTLVIKSGEKKIEKKFLGYEFSNRRRSEGITIYKDENGNPINKLYNVNDPHDTERVSHYIYENGLEKLSSDIPSSLKNHLSYTKLNDLVNFDMVECEKTILLSVKKKSELKKSKYDLVKLGNIIDVKIGGTPTRKNQSYYRNGSIYGFQYLN